MKKYKRWVAHKSGVGPARYPVKAAKAFLKILESAVANAEFTGKEDPDAMVIRVINAHKGATTKAFRPRAYGRSGPWNQDTVNLEIVQEVASPALNAQIMAEKLANALERGWHFRRAGHSTVRRIMEAGAKGCLVVIAGKLTGQRHRTEKFKAGHIKYCGEPRNLWMDLGFASAKLKPGVIGVTVEIMDPRAKLPDEIEIKKPTAEYLAAAAAAAEAERIAPPEPIVEVAAVVGPGIDGESVEEPEPLIVPEEADPAKKVKKSKVAAKRLKKVAKQVSELGVDVDVDTGGGDET